MTKGKIVLELIKYAKSAIRNFDQSEASIVVMWLWLWYTEDCIVLLPGERAVSQPSSRLKMETSIENLVADLQMKLARVGGLLDFYNPQMFPAPVLNLHKDIWMGKGNILFASE